MEESETCELKSHFEWSQEGQQFDLLKTIVAFGNCQGGTLLIQSVSGDATLLDSARLDDFVNKYVAPPMHGLSTSFEEDHSVRVTVAKSPYAPHVIKESGNYTQKGVQKPAFHKGQIYVRHSSKSEPANAEDLQRLIQEAVASWLTSLGNAVAKAGFTNTGSEHGVPIRMVDGGPAMSISFTESHPYSAARLGEKHGKTGAWIGRLTNVEGMKSDPRFCREVLINTSKMYLYSQDAMDKVDELLTKNPNYNPWAA